MGLELSSMGLLIVGLEKSSSHELQIAVKIDLKVIQSCYFSLEACAKG